MIPEREDDVETPGRRATVVLVVEDHLLVAHGVAAGLRERGFIVHVAADLEHDAVVDAARETQPDIVLLDLVLGDDRGTSIALIGPLCATGARVIMVTGVTDLTLLGACVEAGASGVVDKGAPLDHLVEQLAAAADGRTPLPASTRALMLDALRRARVDERQRSAPFDALTRREREVLAALCDGYSAGHIADASFVSLTTVRTQIRSIFRKLGVSSQRAAIAAAHRAGWEHAERAPG
ncbi:MAG TPA: response regulator transcription factor [Acidimicrobiia bacterium]|jgi:DNA-binding NarL/FixJ family response regulator